MNNIFEPKNEKPLWQMLHERLVEYEVNEVITFDEITEALGQDAQTSRTAIYRAAKELLKTNNRYLEAVRNVGYKVIDGMDIVDVADFRHTKAKRQIKRASFELKGIATVRLSPDDKKRLQDFMAYNANIKAAFSNSINRIEKATQVVQVAQAFTEDEIKRLRGLLG